MTPRGPRIRPGADWTPIMPETPDPVPPQYLRGLIASAGITQGNAAKLLHVDPTTLRKWLAPPTAASHRACPWAAAELLRRIAEDLRGLTSGIEPHDVGTREEYADEIKRAHA
jgi:hypothetical protein